MTVYVLYTATHTRTHYSVLRGGGAQVARLATTQGQIVFAKGADVGGNVGDVAIAVLQLRAVYSDLGRLVIL